MTFHPDMPVEYQNQIVTGDARLLAERIPDESVDLILCDPVYWQVEDYSWLAETGNRVLRRGGSCVAEVAHYYLPQVLSAMTQHLDYYWCFSERLGVSGRMWNKRLFVRWKPFLWFWKPVDTGRMGRWMLDSLYSPRDKSVHEWGDGKGTMALLVESLTETGAMVLDPFTGGGTVPAVCKMLGRNYIAFEIDPETAEKARQRVANTQPIMTGFNEAVEQGVLL